MVKKFIIFLNRDNMTVEKSTKLKLNGLVLSQLGVLMGFIVYAIIFYGGQVEKNKDFEEFQVEQKAKNKELETKLFNVSIESGAYANKDWVIRGIKDEAEIREKRDIELKEMINQNQMEIIELLKNKTR